MDPKNTPSADVLAARPSPQSSFSSRLPKKNSAQALGASRDSLTDKLARHAATSPSAASDVSSGTDAGRAGRNGYASASGRRTSLDSLSDTSRGRSAVDRGINTRIPRPSPSQKPTQPTPRRPLTFSDAYRMAEEEEVAAAAQGSPSPAPRPWRAKSGGNGNNNGTAAARQTTTPVSISASESRMQRILAQSPLTYGGRRTARRLGESPNESLLASLRAGSRHSMPGSIGSSSSSSAAADRRRLMHEEDQARMNVALSEKHGLFSPKSRVSPKVAAASRELHRRASNTSLGDKAKASSSSLPVSRGSPSPRPWGLRSRPSSSLTKRMATTPEKESGAGDSRKLDADVTPSLSETVHEEEEEKEEKGEGGEEDKGGEGKEQEQKGPLSAIRTPNKSFAWDADADFTAGDLMASESPPVKVDVEESEVSTTPGGPPPEQKENQPTRNEKLDAIRKLEIDAALLFPDEAIEAAPLSARSETGRSETGRSETGRSETGRSETGRSVTSRSEAASWDEDDSGGAHGSLPTERTNKKIDEIRAREIESLSRRALATARLDEIRERNAEFRAPGRQSSREQLRPEDEEEAAGLHEGGEKTIADEEGGGEGERIPDTPVTIYRGGPRDRGRENNSLGNPGEPPSRTSSSHSRKESQELLRTLARVTQRTSPGPRDETKEGKEGKEGKTLLGGRSRDPETLRPSVGFVGLRRLSLTEADAKAAKRSSVAGQSDIDPTDRIEAEMKLFAAAETHSERGSIRAPSPEEAEEDEAAAEVTPRPIKTVDSLTVDPLTLPTPRVTGAYVETPVTVKTEKTAKPQPILVERAADKGAEGLRRRSRSVSRPRRARVVPSNSARPASVHDDLAEIKRAHQAVDDTTLDNFAEQLRKEAASRRDARNHKDNNDDDVNDNDVNNHNERLRRMSDSVKAGLMDIHRVRKDIERLEDQVSQPSQALPPLPPGGFEEKMKVEIEEIEKEISQLIETEREEERIVPEKARVVVAPSYVRLRLPLPLLFRREPQFQLTLLGVAMLLVAAWVAAEGAVCAVYCRPEACQSGSTCRWSPDDPSFGAAVPVKVDQWLTGGQGRALASWAGDALGDRLADVWDAATGTDLRRVDPTYFTFEEKRRHRRRLQKHGLVAPWTVPEAARPRVEAWRRAREERAAREAEGEDEPERMGADEVA